MRLAMYELRISAYARALMVVGVATVAAGVRGSGRCCSEDEVENGGSIRLLM